MIRHLRVPIMLALVVWLAIGPAASVRASPFRCHGVQVEPADDFFKVESSMIVRADGSVYSPDIEPYPPARDATGDTVNRAGNPTDEPDALCAAMLKLIEPDAPALDVLGFVDTAKFELVLPETPSPELAEATELIAAVVEFQGTFPGSAAGVGQFGISFDSSLYPNYSGSALELVGRDTTFDVYLQDGAWTLGRTEFRNGQFDFTANSNQFAAIVGDGRATIVFPATVVPADVVSVGFFAVSGPGVDVVDLGVLDPESLRTVARAGAVTTQPPSPGPSALATASHAPASTATASPGPGGGGVSTTDGSGDLGWLLPFGLAALALVAAGVIGAAILARRASAETAPIGTVAAGVIASDVALTPLVARAWKDERPRS